MRLAVLGAGAWGSALATSFSGAHRVTLWARRDAHRLAQARESPYLPGERFPDTLCVEGDLATALRDADLVLVATATAGLRDTVRAVEDTRPGLPLLWACKGFETGTRRLPHEVVAEVRGASSPCGALSGPSFALEVSRGQPTAVVLASRDGAFAATTAAALNGPRLRIYSSDDLVGVELGGAVKNVIAIAAGIADGLALGRNARAALVTRGLAEIVRLGVAMGGQPATFMGLAGLGDLVLTCTGELSRNRAVGLALAAGKTLEAALAELGHVSEGVASALAVRDLARERGVDMPIAEAVCGILFGGLSPAAAVRELLAREPKAEGA